MIENSTWGVILDRINDNGLDTEYSIFTWDLGKVKAKATSVRKITSKLAGHLEPGTLARLRLVQKAIDGNYKIAESLIDERTKDPRAMSALLFVDRMTPILQTDIHLFAFLKALVSGEEEGSEASHYRKVLSILGFDPEHAICSICGEDKIAYFIPQDIMFLCHQCLRKTRKGPDQRGVSF
ncbi:MAG: recombination protein O N-terminal domain-containing protein [Candidatus Colwellbacteria bacterium]|nr:recombination protein O N-terminal domain-containing protein [Candidatus Colwellbacteria bacterium]